MMIMTNKSYMTNDMNETKMFRLRLQDKSCILLNIL